MKKSTPSTTPSIVPQAAFFGLILMAIGWLALSLFFEMQLGFPTTPIQWAKRAIGWAVELWLLRTLIVGVRRRYAVKSLA